jgi:hypothetical protein
MSESALDINGLISLYRGHQSVAERSTPEQLRFLHVTTPLDTSILEWLRRGRDVILTGNPGDGKTHLIEFLDLPDGVEKIRDGSQEHPQNILKTWRQCRQQGRPLLMAINHAPLRTLAQFDPSEPLCEELAGLVGLRKLQQSAVDNLVIYSERQAKRYSGEQPPQIWLVDLSQREILTSEVISQLLMRMCPIVERAACSLALTEQCGRCPLHDNARVLSDQRVQANISFVLAYVSKQGYHATMRDLLGLLAFMLTGSKTCDELWEATEDGTACSDDYDYYNQLFCGESPLFEALQQTFDPGQYSDPRIDMQLWHGEVKDGWLLPERQPLTEPSSLVALKGQKRQYFFEHSEPVVDKVHRMQTVVERDFDALLHNDDVEDRLARLVEMINLFYAPLQAHDTRNYRDRLYLWNQHRYSVGQPPGYVAMRSIAANQLRVFPPAVNPWYENALTIRQDHILVAINDWEPGDPGLKVDWEMYRALADAKLGKALEVQPYAILRRLDVFLRGLGQFTGKWSAVETVLWGDYKRREVIEIRVDRRRSAYARD